MTQGSCGFPHSLSRRLLLSLLFFYCNTQDLPPFLGLHTAQGERTVKQGAKVIKEVARNQVQGSFCSKET